MVRSHKVCVAMHVPVAQIFTTERRFLLQNYGNPYRFCCLVRLYPSQCVRSYIE